MTQIHSFLWLGIISLYICITLYHLLWLKAQHSENEDHGIWYQHLMANRCGNNGNSVRLYFFWAPKSLQMVTATMKEKKKNTLTPWKKSYYQPRQHIKKQRHYFANRGPSIRGYGFSSSHVWMWVLDYKEGWALNNWCFWTLVLEKTMGVPWTARRSNQSILKEISLEYSLEGRMLKLKRQYFGHMKSWITWKDPDAGKDWRQKEKGMTDGEMVGWHHQPDGHEFEWTLGVGDGQWGLVCCSPWGHRVGHNWATELNWKIFD